MEASARFAKAGILGAIAAAVGAGIWYAVRAVTDLEIGLIAIVVGLMVGGAVRWGSNGRGGWRYQALAMFLTYASIVSTYVPWVVKAMMENEKKQQAAWGSSSSASLCMKPGKSIAARRWKSPAPSA